MIRVRNQSIWNLIRIVFVGSALLFLVNVYFGFDNALTTGVIPRGQILIHLHAGSVGWITLSLIGLAIWIFTGEREVSRGYARSVSALSYVALAIFPTFVITFGLAFSGGASFGFFGVVSVGAALVIWSSAIFSLSQLSRQPVTTTMHLLVAGGLLVAAVGATVGVLLGLEYSFGRFLPIAPADDRVGMHAGMMDTYIILVAAGIIEGQAGTGLARKWTGMGFLQTLFLVAAALLVPVGYLLQAVEQVFPLFALLMAGGLVTFLVRKGPDALRYNPINGGIGAWTWFGTFWVLVTAMLLMYAAVTFGEDVASSPRWFYTVFTHSTFVGMMTNLLFGLYAKRTVRVSNVLQWGESAALWTMNVGMLVFFVLKTAADLRIGAVVMGLGVLLGLGTMVLRLLADRTPAEGPSSGLPAT